MQTAVNLSNEQAALLAAFSKKTGASEAEILTAALDAFFAARKAEVDEVELSDAERASAQRAALRAALGLWKDRGVSTEEYLDELREGIYAYPGRPDLSDEERVRIRLAGAGLWKDLDLDTDEYLEQLRSEWDR